MSRGPIPNKPGDRPTAREVIALARTFCASPGHNIGGALHIVLDDGNLEEGNIRFCLNALNRGACHCGRRVCGEGVTLALALLKLTRTQRYKVYANLWQ